MKESAPSSFGGVVFEHPANSAGDAYLRYMFVMLRPLYLIAGLLLVALGIIGAFVPLMPTTIFLILAAWCFARSSTRLENWLLNHPRFGQTLRDWRDTGAISRRAKALACSGIALGFVLFWIGARPGLWLWLLVAAILAACAAFILTRPDPAR